MSIVAVAGGTGKLGRTIVDAILDQGEHRVVILTRLGSGSGTKELDVPVLEIDYSNVEAIKEVLQSNNISTVISALSSTMGTEPEIALIKAADASTTTKRFIPNSWGIRYTPGLAEIFPIAEAKIAAFKVLEATTTLEYTVVINGFFLDYYVIPKIPSRMGPFPVVIDMINNAAAIPGSGDVPVAFTHTADVARFAVSLLSLPRWQPESYVVGEKLTWKEFLAIAEETKGIKFDVKFDTLEQLEKNQVTELPGQKDLYPFFPKQMLQSFVATFGIMFEKGFFDFDDTSIQGNFKARSVRELVRQAWQS